MPNETDHGKEKAQTIRNENWDISTDPADILKVH